MKLEISELRGMSNQLFDYLEETGQTSIELDADYYWTITKDDLYNPYEQPKRIYLGQLYSDYESLEKIQKGKLPPVAYGLVWLSSLLRYIGEKIVK
jgi:hypothetical protein